MGTSGGGAAPCDVLRAAARLVLLTEVRPGVDRVLHCGHRAVPERARVGRQAVRRRRPVRAEEGQPHRALGAPDASLGLKLRRSVGSELLQSQVCHTQDDVFNTSERWKAAMQEKGWR